MICDQFKKLKIPVMAHGNFNKREAAAEYWKLATRRGNPQSIMTKHENLIVSEIVCSVVGIAFDFYNLG